MTGEEGGRRVGEDLRRVASQLIPSVKRIRLAEAIEDLEPDSDPSVERVISRIGAGTVGLNPELSKLALSQSAPAGPGPARRRVDADHRRAER